MQEGIGFITEIRLFKDKYKIIQIYCQSGDIVSGLVRNNSKKDTIYQMGNFVKYNHFRKEKTLGIIDCEGEVLYTSIFFDDRLKYNMVIYFIFLLKSFFKDSNSICNLVDLCVTFFDNLKSKERITKKEYLDFESKLLHMTGLCSNALNNADKKDFVLTNLNIIEDIYYQFNNYNLPKEILLIRAFVVKSLQ